MLPLVSVRVITYNHEKYIAQCLEGILMQRTNFPFEIIVGEDCSMDKTQEIVLDYEKRFPGVIRMITSAKNVGGRQNSIRLVGACQGKYHSLCEGDDYWIDPLKLQKQVDFLETHPEHAMCFHNALTLTEGKMPPPQYACPPDLQDTITLEDVVLRTYFIPTASIVLRGSVANTLPKWREKYNLLDLITLLWCGHHGNLGYLDEIMSVYRKHPQGLSRKIESEGGYFAEIKQILTEFDRETDYLHTDLIQRRIKTVDQKHSAYLRRRKYGYLYFLLRPDKAYERLRHYARAVNTSRYM
jgi:glycosyltransferase involved in cell wall biosynthesis